MIRALLFIFVFVLISLASSSQENTPIQKECRISSGFGFSNSLRNTTGIGTDFWIQLSYDVISNFSIATEFENLDYNLRGYFPDFQVSPNEVNVYNNNFSLLIKYNFSTQKKLKIALASGWTYCITQSQYYSGSAQNPQPSVTTYNDYRIPILAQLEYPVARNLHLQARLKYTTNGQGGTTYAGGIGLSLKL